MTKRDLGNTNGEKIENLNLVALRKYACPKIMNEKEWYMKCMDCPTISMCKTGERAKELLEKETAPVTTAKKIHTILSTQWVSSAYHILALEQKDPIGWYAERRTKGNRREAGMLLRSFKKNAGIAPGEILTRDNFIIAHPKYKNTGKPAAEIIAELEKKGKLVAKKEEKNMKNKPCDIEGDIDGDETTDKISIEDFLTSTSISAEKSIPNTITKTHDAGIACGKTISQQEAAIVLFSQKRKKLKEDLEKTSRQIKELTAHHKKLEDDLHILDSAAALFGMKPKSQE
jgi:hypothetical protein